MFSVARYVACDLVSQGHGLDVCQLCHHQLVVLKVVCEPIVVVPYKVDCHAFDVSRPDFSHDLAPLRPVNADGLF